MKKLIILTCVLVVCSMSTAWAAPAKLSALTELAVAPAESDEVYVNDGGVSKKIQVLNLVSILEAALTAYEIHADNLPANSPTATALAANGGNCSAGSYPLGVDASGAVESCTDATTEIDSVVAAAIAAMSWSGGDLTGTGLGPQVNEAGVDHDSLANFVANEHIDWTSDQGATNISNTNIVMAASDLTDAANIAHINAGESITGAWDFTTDILFSERADHASTPGAGKGYLWVKSTTPSTIIFTDDAGTDFTLGEGGSANISDTAYNITTWNADTTDGASKNALRDYFALFDTDGDGDIDNIDAALGSGTITTIELDGVVVDATVVVIDFEADDFDVTEPLEDNILVELDAQVPHLNVADIITANWVNEANPWDISDETNLVVDTNELTLTGDSLGLADHATARTALGLAIGSDVQAYGAALDIYSGISPSANMQTFLANANYADARTDLDVYSKSEADAAFEGELTNSAGLYGALSDETGSGGGTPLAVFNYQPVLTGFSLAGAVTGISTTDEFQATAGQDIVFQLGDAKAVGVNKVSFQDVDGSEVLSFLSDGTISQAQKTTPSNWKWYEGSGTGQDYRALTVPTNLTETLTYTLPNGNPSANAVWLIGAPAAEISTMSYANFSTDNFDITAGSITIKDLGVSMAEVNASGTPDATTFLRGDGAWTAVSASANTDGGEGGVQINAAGAIDAETNFRWLTTPKTLMIVVNGANEGIEIGDGTHTPSNGTNFYTEGAIEIDGLIYADGGVSSGGILLGDTTPDASGEIGYATNAFKWFANSEDMVLTAGTNTWTFSSATGVSDISLTAMNLVTTGTITGRLKWGTDVSTTPVSHDTTALHGVMYLVTAAATINLDAPADTGYGGNACYVIRDAAEAVIIDIDGSTKLNLDGTAQAVGVGVTATGAGEKICVIASTDVDGSGGDGYWIWGNTSGWASQ